MGMIKITGTAKREVTADIMRISITVSARERTPELAIREGKENAEKLLRLLVELGIDVAKVEMRDEKVSDDLPYGSNSTFYCYKKEVAVKTKLDLALLEAISTGISQKKIAAEYSEMFEYSGETAMIKEALCEALEDSRSKATALAQMLGQAVKGIEEIKGATGANDNILRTSKPSHYLGEKTALAAKLAPYIIEITKSIDVTWIVE